MWCSNDRKCYLFKYAAEGFRHIIDTHITMLKLQMIQKNNVTSNQ